MVLLDSFYLCPFWNLRNMDTFVQIVNYLVEGDTLVQSEVRRPSIQGP